MLIQPCLFLNKILLIQHKLGLCIAATVKHLGLPLISRDSRMPLSGVSII